MSTYCTPNDVQQHAAFLETIDPAKVQQKIVDVSGRIDARFGAAFVVPFSSPYPQKINDAVAIISAAELLQHFARGGGNDLAALLRDCERMLDRGEMLLKDVEANPAASGLTAKPTFTDAEKDASGVAYRLQTFPTPRGWPE